MLILTLNICVRPVMAGEHLLNIILYLVMYNVLFIYHILFRISRFWLESFVPWRCCCSKYLYTHTGTLFVLNFRVTGKPNTFKNINSIKGKKGKSIYIGLCYIHEKCISCNCSSVGWQSIGPFVETKFSGCLAKLHFKPSLIQPELLSRFCSLWKKKSKKK